MTICVDCMCIFMMSMKKKTSPEMSGDMALGRFKRVIARGAFPLHLGDKYETQDCAHTYRQA